MGRGAGELLGREENSEVAGQEGEGEGEGLHQTRAGVGVEGLQTQTLAGVGEPPHFRA